MPIAGFVLYFGLPILLQSLLLYLLLRRNALHNNPWFFIYTVFSIAATITRLVFFRNAPVYFYLYWGSEVIYAVLQLLASYEIWESMFRYYFRFWWVKSISYNCPGCGKHRTVTEGVAPHQSGCQDYALCAGF